MSFPTRAGIYQTTHGVSDEQFTQAIEEAKAEGKPLTREPEPRAN
jgi:hypothetical protein